MRIIVFGAGGFAREIAWLAEDCGHEPVAYVDRAGAPAVGTVLGDLPVVDLAEARARFSDAAAVVAVGDPLVRRRVAGEASAAGFGFATLVHPNASVSRRVEIGEGTVICTHASITTDIRIGRHCHVNLNVTIGHDTVIGDFCAFTPGVQISGRVRIGDGVTFGTGSVAINGSEDAFLEIGEGAVVGAQACVVRDVPPGVTVVGVPAKARS